MNRKKPTDWAGLIIVLGLLFIAIGSVPLIDPSEARYATIAQRMVLSNNWLIPEINRGEGFIPFWGKPPLHIWLVAVSMKFFGFSEFAARFPSFVALCAVIFLCSRFARHLLSREIERFLPFVILTSPLLISVGLSCLIDATFYMWITLALVSFALVIEGKGSRRWRYLFFLGLGAAFLTKGPLALALVGFVIGTWLLVYRDWRVLTRLPWLMGLPLSIAIAAPWFVIAGKASPGLLKYFFVNENFQRFISPNYVDFYGSSHPTFRGVILCYLLIALLPLGLFFSKKLLTKEGRSAFRITGKWNVFLILWALAPVAVFLPSKNVLITYVLPGAPAIAILFAKGIVYWKVEAFCFVKKYYRIVFFGFLVLGMGAFLIENAATSSALAWLISMLIIYTLAKNSRQSIFKTMYLCLATEATVVWMLFAFSPWLADSLSTKLLIHSLDEADAEKELTFSSKLPYSALFYLQADPDTRKNLPVKEDSTVNPRGDLAVKRKDLGELSADRQRLLEHNEGTQNWAIVDTDQDDINKEISP